MSSLFDLEIDRRPFASLKWASPPEPTTDAMRPSMSGGAGPSAGVCADLLPMWVADMDFRVPQAVIDALVNSVEHGVFGYSMQTDGYADAVCEWQLRRFGWRVADDWLVPVPSVVNALNLVVNAFSQPGDGVLVQTPVYHHFMNDTRCNGREVIEAPLVHDESTFSYVFDPVAFEAAITPRTRIFLLCNPHNPTGNVWTANELRQMGEICLRHDVLIVSDEIHQDLVFRPARHVPFASLDRDLADRSIICTAPSKTFNLAGLKCSNLFIPGRHVRQLFCTMLERTGTGFVNTLGAVACEAAYRHGEPWLEEMLAYVAANRHHFAEQIACRVAGLRVLESASLYLAWMDCRGLGLRDDELQRAMLERARLRLDPGIRFGDPGAGFMRVNLACPRSRVDAALDRLCQAFVRN